MPDIGTGISAAASIAGSAISSSGAKDAAKTQAGAVDAGIASQERMFNQNRADLAPWRSAGSNALGQLSRLLGDGVPGSAAYSKAYSDYHKTIEDYNAANAEYQALWSQPSSASRNARIAQLDGEIKALNSRAASLLQTAKDTQGQPADPQFGSLMKDFSLADFQADPSYEFRRNEGQRGINNSAAARGMQLSGATLKALNRYNSDLASQEYGSAYARDAANKERKFNMLSGVAGTGQTATNTTAALGASSANNIASLLSDRGNALAAGQVGSSNAWSGGFGDVINNYQQSQLLNRLFPATGSGGSSGYSGGFTNPTAIGGANSLYVPRIA